VKVKLLNADQELFVFGACAGAALYRRKMLDAIGFFDEDFFLIHEDTDLNLRAQLAGWKVLYVPSAVVYHKVRSSIGRMSDTAVYYTLRNSEFVRIKNMPCGVFLRCLPAFILGMITEFIYFSIKHRKFLIYCRAKRDALAMLPVMLKKRKAIMHGKAVPDNYLINIMSSAFARDFFKAKLRKLIHG
jgi:GT2 family glycosyltransferase